MKKKALKFLIKRLNKINNRTNEQERAKSKRTDLTPERAKQANDCKIENKTN